MEETRKQKVRAVISRRHYAVFAIAHSVTLFYCMSVLAAEGSVAEVATNKATENNADGTHGPFCWIPKWHDKGDCGPMALYVLLNLEGKTRTVADVKSAVPFDAVQGCSLGSLSRAAEAFGLPADVCYVAPQLLGDVSCPFIVHGMTSVEQHLGHFLVVVDFDQKAHKFAVIDPVWESFDWIPESSILRDYSGYILAPSDRSLRRWNEIVGVLAVLCSCYLFWSVFGRSWSRTVLLGVQSL